MIARLRCMLRSHHNPTRHPLGGFRCAECGQVGADLEEMGFADGGYVLPVRRVFSRDQLMNRVWGYTRALDTGTITVHMRRLREKVEPDPSRPRYLETVWGAGYRFTP